MKQHNPCCMSLNDGVNDLFTKEPLHEQENKIIHIRAQQRKKRKAITTIEGINSSVDLKKLLKAFKKEFGCNGTIVNDEELGDVIQLQGDQRKGVFDFLISSNIAEEKELKMHGF